MENLTPSEVLQEDGHTQHLPSYTTLLEMFEALQEVTGNKLRGNEGFYAEHPPVSPSVLMHTLENEKGEDIWRIVQRSEYEQVAERVGVSAAYAEEWMIEYCDGDEGRIWSDLED